MLEDVLVWLISSVWAVYVWLVGRQLGAFLIVLSLVVGLARSPETRRAIGRFLNGSVGYEE